MEPLPHRPLETLVSVVIPTHDRRDRVLAAVESVIEQRWQAWELVVVDDGSTDGTAEHLAQAFADPRISIVRLDSCHGVSFARNHGVSLCSGPLLAFLDSDDIWHREKLLEQVRWLERTPHMQVCQTQEIWIRHGKRVNPPSTHCKRAGDLFETSLERCMITPSSVMIRRSIFDELGGFNEALPSCEDYDLWLRLTCRHNVGLVDRYLLTRHGGHDDQLSSRFSVMDRFRIRALLDIVYGGKLNSNQQFLAQRMLAFRAGIVANGFLKRGNKDEYEHYRAIAELFRDPAQGS